MFFSHFRPQVLKRNSIFFPLVKATSLGRLFSSQIFFSQILRLASDSDSASQSSLPVAVTTSRVLFQLPSFTAGSRAPKMSNEPTRSHTQLEQS